MIRVPGLPNFLPGAADWLAGWSSGWRTPEQPSLFHSRLNQDRGVIGLGGFGRDLEHLAYGGILGDESSEIVLPT